MRSFVSTLLRAIAAELATAARLLVKPGRGRSGVALESALTELVARAEDVRDDYDESELPGEPVSTQMLCAAVDRYREVRDGT